MIIDVVKSWRKDKKWAIVFNNHITVHIGALGYEDYTQHKDNERKKRYIARHAHNGYTDKYAPNTLSRFLLWEYTDLNKAIKEYNKRFFK
jgi:hypothetical protein